MNHAKWWTVAAHEYGHHVRSKGFLGTTLAFPILMLVAIGLIALFISRGESVSAVGYVDQSGLTAAQPQRVIITDTLAPDVPVLRYVDETAAREAVVDETIVGYVVIPADYLQTGLLRGVAQNDSLPDFAQRTLNTFLRDVLTSQADPAFQERLKNPLDNIIQRSQLSGREATREQGLLLFMVPYLFGLFFLISVFGSSSYLMTSLVEEKENRVMEILATSLNPFQLMSGKILGLGLLGLTLILVWLVTSVLIFFIAQQLFADLALLTLPWNVIIVAMVLFVPTYVLMAACLSAVGAAVSAVQEGQQLSGFFSLLMFAPLWLLPVILESPNGALSVVLSMLPFTAPLVLMQRIALVDVPLWQIIASVGFQSLGALIMIWVASRVLRYGMLRYGKRLAVRELVQALRG